MSQSAFVPSRANEYRQGLPSRSAVFLRRTIRPGNAPYMPPMRVSSTISLALSITGSASSAPGSGASDGHTATATRVRSCPSYAKPGSIPSACANGVNVFTVASFAHSAAFGTPMRNTREPSPPVSVPVTGPGMPLTGGLSKRASQSHTMSADA